MASLDVSKDWVVIAPPDDASRFAAREIARALGLLRRRAGLSSGAAPAGIAPEIPAADGRPCVVLNGDGSGGGGYSWRAGAERVEVFGTSPAGLLKGVSDFLAALGLSWPEIAGPETLPAPEPEGSARYALARRSAHQSSGEDPALRRRLVISRDTPAPALGDTLLWGLRQGIDAVVLPLGENYSLPGISPGIFPGPRRRAVESLVREAERHGLAIEEGGWDLSLLVSAHFFSGREVYRMEGGRRSRKHNFCPTSPKTIARIRAGAERFFGKRPAAAVFHLWPDRGAEDLWCACPSCRAFSRNEQNRIAVNAAADVLARINPAGRVSYAENPADGADPFPPAGEVGYGAEVSPRPNMFRISLPEGTLARRSGALLV